MGEDHLLLYFVGTAGSGKTSLTAAFQRWMQRQGYNVTLLNLDPGVDVLPYEPDIDIRDWVSLPQVMEEYDLGPNGAQVVAADLLALNIGKVSEVLEGLSEDYVLVDTPGQIELFAFRESSERILEALGDRHALAFCIDPILARKASSLATQLLLSLTVQFRLQAPSFDLLTKADLLSDEEVARIIQWSAQPESFYDAIGNDSSNPLTPLSQGILRTLESTAAGFHLTPVSATHEDGLADLYSQIQAIFFGGEDLEPR